MQKEYAGDDLAEIRRFYMEDHEIRYTKVFEERGADGFTLAAPNGPWGEDNGVDIYVVVWPRPAGGYWSEEY
jgi:hypothetical protein